MKSYAESTLLGGAATSVWNGSDARINNGIDVSEKFAKRKLQMKCEIKLPENNSTLDSNLDLGTAKATTSCFLSEYRGLIVSIE